MAGKSLALYYSWTNRNTKRIAELAQKATEADLAVIDTVFLVSTRRSNAYEYRY